MLFRIFFSIVAIVFGFFFPGIFGAIVFALIFVFVINGAKVKTFKLLRVLTTFVIAFIAGFSLMWFFGLMGAHEILHQRVHSLRTELIQMGHKPRWFIISQKRNKVYNSCLAYSIDGSRHLKGKAIDLYIIDINGDNQYDINDFNLIKRAHDAIQKRNRKNKGNVYNYLKKGVIARRMVHIQLN